MAVEIDPPAISSPPNASATVPVRLPSAMNTLGTPVYSGGAALVGATGSALNYPLMGVYWDDGDPPGHVVDFPGAGAKVTGVTKMWDSVDPSTPPPNFAAVTARAVGTGSLLVTVGGEPVELTGFTPDGSLRAYTVLVSLPPEEWLAEGLPFEVAATGPLSVSLLAIELVYPVGSCYATDWIQASSQNKGLPRRTGGSTWTHNQTLPTPGLNTDTFESIFESADPGSHGFSHLGSLYTYIDSQTSRKLTQNINQITLDNQDYKAGLMYTGEPFYSPGSSFRLDDDPATADHYYDSQGYEWEGNGYGAYQGIGVVSDYGSPEHYIRENATGDRVTATDLSNVSCTFTVYPSPLSDTTKGQPLWTVFEPGVLDVEEYPDGSPPQFYIPRTDIATGTPRIASKPAGSPQQTYTIHPVPEAQPGVFALGLGLDPSWQADPGWLKPPNYGTWSQSQAYVQNITFTGDVSVGRVRFLYDTVWQPGVAQETSDYPWGEGPYEDEWRFAYGGTLGPVVYPEIRGPIIVIPNPEDPDSDPWAWARLPPGAGLNDWMWFYLDKDYIRIMYGGRVVLVWRLPKNLRDSMVAGGAGMGFYNPRTKQYLPAAPPGSSAQPYKYGPQEGWSYLVDTQKWVGESGGEVLKHGVRIDADDLLFFPDRVVGGQALQDDVITSAPVKYLAGRELPPVIVDYAQAGLAYDAGYGYALYPVEGP